MWRLIDFLYVGVLIGYALAGVQLTPFHGDESTTIYTSSDFDTLFLRGDLAHIIYRQPPPSDDPQAATKQDLRILNGVLSKYTYGFARWVSGLDTLPLNGQWIWGASWDYNQAQGNLPSPLILFVTRWASALLLALSIAFVFASSVRLGGYRSAYLATLVSTLMPAVMLNGRRAVYESAALLTEVLLFYVTLQLISRRATFKGALALGLAAGLAIAAKHTGVLFAVAAAGSMMLYPLLRLKIRQLFNTGLMIFGAGVIAALTFLAFNASWWSQPLAMPGIVLARRIVITNTQADLFGEFQNPLQRISALVNESLSAPPQYYEAGAEWQTWIGDQIARYEASGLAGASGIIWRIVVGLLILVGLARMLIKWRQASTFALLFWFGLLAISLYALTPFDWQRYYLPLTIPLALLGGMTFATKPVTER